LHYNIQLKRAVGVNNLPYIGTYYAILKLITSGKEDFMIIGDKSVEFGSINS
jgi:hypothetical protein